MNRFILAQTAHEIDALKPAWEWLYLQQSEATFFQSFYWNRLAAECFRDERPTVVFVETDSGAALIPAAVRKDSHLCLLGEELFDYRDVLWAGDCSVLTRAWRILAERGLPLAQTPVCMGSTPERWSIFEIEDFCHAPCIAQGTGPDDFAASHSRLARQLRRLARVGVTVERHSVNVSISYPVRGVEAGGRRRLPGPGKPIVGGAEYAVLFGAQPQVLGYGVEAESIHIAPI